MNRGQEGAEEYLGGPHITELKGEALRKECALSYGVGEDASCGNCLLLEVTCPGKVNKQNVCMGHLREQPFLCPLCGGKAYICLGTRRLYGGVTQFKYECSGCSITFNDPIKLTKHNHRIHSDRQGQLDEETT